MMIEKNDRPAWEWLSESDNLERDTLLVFDEHKLARLMDLMGPKSELPAIKSGLQMTITRYLQARLLAPSRAPGKAERKRMLRFEEAAKSYAKALEGLMANGNADQRLILDIYFAPKDRIGDGELQLQRKLDEGGPRSALRQLQRQVEATSRSAHRLAIEPFEDETGGTDAAYQEMIAPLSKPDDKRRIEVFCLTEGLKAFQRVWIANSDKPFNAGKYYSDIGGFVGDAIAATYLVMNMIDPIFTERRIARVIREIN